MPPQVRTGNFGLSKDVKENEFDFMQRSRFFS